MPGHKGIKLIVDEEISLCQFSVDDVDDIFALIDRNREHLSQNGDITARKYPDRESVLESIVNPVNPSRLRFGIWASGTYVCTINLTPDKGRDSAELGCYLGREFSGRGYMSRSMKRIVRYGFDELGLPEIYGKVHRNNQRSISLVTSLGFAADGSKSNDNEIYFSIKQDRLSLRIPLKPFYY